MDKQSGIGERLIESAGYEPTIRSTQNCNGTIIQELWQYRELFLSLVIRDLKVKYQRSFLGLIWTFLNPLLTVVVLIAVFSHVIRIQIDHYWAFLVSGFFAWHFIQMTLYNATTILANNASLSRSVYFPREILILSTAASKLVEFLFETTIVLMLLSVFYYDSIPLSLSLLPTLIMIQLVMVIGLMFPVAVISVLFHDVQHALPIIITSFFYLTPVFYPASMIPESLRPFYYLNPFAGLFELYHLVIYEGVWPSIQLLGGVGLYATAICFVGYWIFKRYKGVCVEIA